ncbi:MAG TPA: ParB/Srx family N-terminal domain-containing protein [Candidatus Cybelea sp.]|nr:ParB/Srx family N-terminal domain-containing protein [Candidatus Cybelea sp.]
MTTWPADHVERRPLSALIPTARNARTHSDAQIEQIARSISEWGWTMPVLIDESGSIIAGHGRVLAAAKLGLGDVPTIIAAGWSEAQKRAYLIADNKLTENGGWNQALLKLEVADLSEMGFAVPLLGFTEKELAETVPDASPQLSGLRYAVVIRCRDENEQRGLLARFSGEGLTVEALIS